MLNVSLINKFNDLNSQDQSLQNESERFRNELNDLNPKYSHLINDFNDLNSQHQILQNDYESLRKEFNSLRR